MSDGIDIRVKYYSAPCSACARLSRWHAVRRSPIGREIQLLRDGVMHALPADGDADQPMCEALR